MLSTFGSSLRAFRSSLGIGSSLFALPDATLTRLIRPTKSCCSVGRIRRLRRIRQKQPQCLMALRLSGLQNRAGAAIQVNPTNRAPDRAPGE
ncbi:hypothetical protein D6V68_00015 [Escherichia albertii]|nr:hypothetical protein [Escherichia albertii]EEW7495119.1 hypothetical protein [Escherichia albertii]EEW7549228.1 hypothetical protein [Escherichia albertii]EFO0111195.1 hypothetical protein [Escherichia albertii]EFO1267179.1 hypothetical protein [Escherichia albertii]